MSLDDEELDAIAAYDKAKASNSEAIPLAEAIKEIEHESNDNNQLA